MGSPIGLGDVLAIIDKAVIIYYKIKDAPEQIEDVGDRMKDLEQYLKPVKDFLEDRNRLARLRPDQTKYLKGVCGKMETDAKKVYDVLKKWHDREGPGGLEFRFDFMAQSFSHALWALGSSPKELEKLVKNLERQEQNIDRQLPLMLGFGHNALVMQLNIPNRAAQRPKIKRDVNILFVESFNEGRSVVSQAYGRLVQEWTTRTNHLWRISLIHSAGLLVKSRGDIVEEQESIKLPMVEGGKAPSAVALDALFDNKLFNYPYKEKIRLSTNRQRSRGLTKVTFLTYDYIILFNHNDSVRIQKLKATLRKKFGNKAVQKGKGKTILLGEYGTSKYDEIWDPPRADGKTQSREDWNRTVSNIKVSFKGFLKEEMDWIQPSPGAIQNSTEDIGSATLRDQSQT